MIMKDVRERYEGFQSLCKDLNEFGCNFLCLCSIIEEENKNPIDIIDVIRVSQKKGWLRSDFYVEDNIAILRHFTHKEWIREQVTELKDGVYDNQYTIAIYQNITKNSKGERVVYTHFRRRYFDTLVSSNTVKNGKIIGYYIYTCKR